MEKLILNEAKKIWTEIAKNKTPGDIKLEVEIYKKLINIFQIGDYYYLIFNPPEMKVEYVSPLLTEVLGYDNDQFTLDALMRAIHPEDLPYFMDFEATVAEFFTQLPPEKVMKYKSRYDYRMRKTNGDYIRVLQQIVTIQSDSEGAVLRTFVVHTDITHLKKDTRMILSFIGLDGEPSYIDVQPKRKFTPSREVLTHREKEILRLLAAQKTSREIAEQLFISKETVNTHRKNMLKKTGMRTTLSLVTLALEKGWI